jgi:hypothetical protein
MKDLQNNRELGRVSGFRNIEMPVVVRPADDSKSALTKLVWVKNGMAPNIKARLHPSTVANIASLTDGAPASFEEPDI